MNPSDEIMGMMAQHLEGKGYDVVRIIRHTIMAERVRCLQIATLPNMAVKDIVRAIKSGEWIKTDNE
jgi:hypothetical protein